MEAKEEAKEIQQTIVPKKEKVEHKATEEELSNALKIISPGTNFRAGIDGILKAKKGAIIVVENDEVLPILDGGFKINCKFTPQKLIELSKMDGAMILSGNLKKINFANALLTPSSKIKTSETGTKHKAAERTAKQTGALVIAISERKNEVHLFYKNLKYHLKETGELLRKVNEHIQILEKQKDLFDSYVANLNKMELNNHPSLNHAISTIQKGEIIRKIAEELKRDLVELGSEGVLLKTRFKEILGGVEKETSLILKDYTLFNLKRSKNLLTGMSYDDLIDKENIRDILGHSSHGKIDFKGWRLLSKTSLQDDEVAKILEESNNFENIINKNIKLSKVMGEEREKLMHEELQKMKFFSSTNF